MANPKDTPRPTDAHHFHIGGGAARMHMTIQHSASGKNVIGPMPVDDMLEFLQSGMTAALEYAVSYRPKPTRTESEETNNAK